MLKKIWPLISLFILQQLSLSAQTDTSVKMKAPDTIRMTQHSYFYNNKKMSPVRLGSMLTKVSISKPEYKRYSNQAVTGAVLVTGAVASGILAIAYHQQKVPFLIGMATLGGIGIPLMLNARKHLKRSVILFNGAVRK